MNENSKNNEVYLIYWLLISLFLVSSIIVVGGLTRLTDSGLSITEWNLISGIFPPTSNDDWEKAFNLYKETPEFKLVNPLMNLQEFKVIYWWEFIHRFLGRIIGLFFLIPLIYFTLKKSLGKKQIISFYLIFLLILFQGIIGWYMVKSGLTEKTDVSHYRLAFHLIFAFIIFISLLWNYLKCKNQQNRIHNKRLPSYLPILFISCVLIQICVGAFVSGLDAGQIYQTWPLMNHSYFPDDFNIEDLFSINSLETPSIVQFIHRNIAYFIILLFSLIATMIYRNKDFVYLRSAALLVFVFLFLQTFLGILTVLSGAQIIFASMHQIGSILLITSSLILVFKNSRIN